MSLQSSSRMGMICTNLTGAISWVTVRRISMSSTPTMSFFVTSAGSGKGGDLGGLAGADALCQRLASAAGSAGRTWRAYLSAPPTFASGSNPAVPAVNARDRIGSGPWFNAKGELMARVPTAPPSRRSRTRPAAPGPRAAKARRSSATTTASARCRRTGRPRGTSRTPRPAAARRHWCAPAAPAGCTASRPTRRKAPRRGCARAGAAQRRAPSRRRTPGSVRASAEHRRCERASRRCAGWRAA